ncbi:MAG: glycosyltransferase family 4 protein [Bacteroidales bacterium]|nr:glycosyltransferase family 4 protein [Bacteroidales bacterium]
MEKEGRKNSALNGSTTEIDPQNERKINMKNALIISYSFPPLNDIAARRFGEMSPFMPDYGLRPWIISTNSVGDLPVQVPEAQCIRIGLHPQRSMQIEDRDINANTFKMPVAFKVSRKIAKFLGLGFRSFDRTVVTWYPLIKKQTEMIVASIPKPDVIIGSFGPAASLWAARYLASFYNVPWVADFRDLGALHWKGRGKLSREIDLLIENRLLASASGLMTVGDVLANALEKKYKKRCCKVYNGWVRNSSQESPVENKEGEKYIYYAGRIYLHRMNSFFLLLDALKDAQTIHLKIRSLGPKLMEEKLLEYAQSIGLEKRLELLEPTDQLTVQKEAEMATMNLVVEDLNTSDPYSAGTLTGKFLQLLAFTPPVLSITRTDSEMSGILKETNKGKVCSGLKQVIEFISACLNDPERYQGNQSISKYSKLEQAKIMCSFFNQIISRTP